MAEIEPNPNIDVEITHEMLENTGFHVDFHITVEPVIKKLTDTIGIK